MKQSFTPYMNSFNAGDVKVPLVSAEMILVKLDDGEEREE